MDRSYVRLYFAAYGSRASDVPRVPRLSYSLFSTFVFTFIKEVRVQHWCRVRLSLTNSPDVSRRFRHCDRRDCRLISVRHFVRVCRSAHRVDLRRDYRRRRDCRHRRDSPPDFRASVDRSFDFRRRRRRCRTFI